jgi:hypothetical protein
MFKHFDPDEKVGSDMEHDLGGVWHKTNQVISMPEVRIPHRHLSLIMTGIADPRACGSSFVRIPCASF